MILLEHTCIICTHIIVRSFYGAKSQMITTILQYWFNAHQQRISELWYAFYGMRSTHTTERSLMTSSTTRKRVSWKLSSNWHALEINTIKQKSSCNRRTSRYLGNRAKQHTRYFVHYMELMLYLCTCDGASAQNGQLGTLKRGNSVHEALERKTRNEICTCSCINFFSRQ